MNEPCLSIVIACLNAEEYLGHQLNALACQDFDPQWELLICDNGSVDGTVALARSWSDRLPLRVIDASAVPGSGPARNVGVQAARAEWIGFCDADDEVGQGWLSSLATALAERPFVAGPFDDTKLNSARVRRSRPNDQRSGLQYLTPGIGLPHAGAGNLGIRRSVFHDVGGFDPQVRYLQDTDLCWRVQLAGHPLTFEPGMLVHVRLRSTWRGMFRQGRNFGLAQARLERRYADAGPKAAPEAVRVQRSGSAPAPRRWPRFPAWALSSRIGISGKIWQLGWHLGHRAE